MRRLLAEEEQVEQTTQERKDGGTLRRRLYLALFLVLVSFISVAAVIAWNLLYDPHVEFNTVTSIIDVKGDDIFLEDPLTLAMAAGSWISKAKLPLPSDSKMEEIAKTNPIAFVKFCIRRYDYDVQGYELILKKQERNGELQKSEIIGIKFREEPFSVLLEWLKGTERLAHKTLYVRGENNDKLLVRGTGLLKFAGIVERDPEGEQAKQSGRYPLTEFGIKYGMLRTVSAWENARAHNALHIQYLGLQKVPELGDRLCYAFTRNPYDIPEEDGIKSLWSYYDKETWLQVGSILKNEQGELIADYWFSDIKLNPVFPPDTFTRKSLK